MGLSARRRLYIRQLNTGRTTHQLHADLLLFCSAAHWKAASPDTPVQWSNPLLLVPGVRLGSQASAPGIHRRGGHVGCSACLAAALIEALDSS